MHVKLHELQPSKTYYVVNCNRGDAKGKLFNVKNYDVLEGTIKIIDGKYFLETSIGSIKLTHNTKIFSHKLQAENFKYELIIKFLKDDICQKLSSEDYPPPAIAPNSKPIISSNPLRFGERNVSYSAQSNTYGTEKNEQKILQLLAMTREDLHVIMNIISVVPFINDYSKKLLGKYAIVELNSLHKLLENLKSLNRKYADEEFVKLQVDIGEFERKYNFRKIRDKIAAHKDSNLDLLAYGELWKNIRQEIILEYYNLFMSHLETILNKYYPDEKVFYFTMSNMPLAGFSSERIANDYFPFHDFEM